MSPACAAQHKPMFPKQPLQEPETKSEGMGQEKSENLGEGAFLYTPSRSYLP